MMLGTRTPSLLVPASLVGRGACGGVPWPKGVGGALCTALPAWRRIAAETAHVATPRHDTTLSHARQRRRPRGVTVLSGVPAGVSVLLSSQHEAQPFLVARNLRAFALGKGGRLGTNEQRPPDVLRGGGGVSAHCAPPSHRGAPPRSSACAVRSLGLAGLLGHGGLPRRPSFAPSAAPC